ncbi:MAG TPA: hypothetical protein VII38_18465 [Polyangia bacterium]
MIAAFFAAVAVVGLAPAGAITVKLPTLGQLEQAARSGDAVELERVAARLGVVRLARIASRGTRAERLAALRAIPLEDDAWAVLPEVAQLGGGADFEVAEAAATCARKIAEGLSPEVADAREIPRDVPEKAARELSALAARAELAPSVRVAALAALGALGTVAPVDIAALEKLLSDEEPQVRRAAAESLDGASAAEPALEKTLAADPVATVAAAAAATLCRDVPPAPVAVPPPAKGKTKKPVASSMPDTLARAAEARAASLAPAARARLRALATDGKVPLADRLDLLGCVRVAAQPADQQLLDKLARRPPESLRRRARSLGGR